MFVEVRKTAQGTEYWDTKAKKTLFVAEGKKPNFEVTKNPKSMLEDDTKDDNIDGEMNIEDMTVKQLRAFAKQQEIEIPADITKKEDIVKFLTDTE